MLKDKRYDLDERDLKILEILKKDARTSFTEIARTLNISEGAVRRRVEHLENSGIIKKFTIETSLPTVKAIILVSTTPEVPNPTISKEIRSLEGVDWVYEVTGQFDITVSVSGPNMTFINKCIDEIRSVKGVLHTNTLIVLREW
ncbi:MAG: Lrp/AsnC family transcriptional regulator [Thaumarchaeota archaeon]|jgi:DNA-binding Lrp family transcriptional regulator|nr:Lrp/AsnC family transcriptional regulator [Nitrososphaerota archaeon]